MFGLAAAALIAVASPDAQSAEIAKLEKKWGEAFVSRDFAFIESIVAPEYRLVGVNPDGSFDVTPRAPWMANARAFQSHAFTAETVDVNRVGNVAVASVRGTWTVTRRPGTPPRANRFFVTDTWLRRNGKWQVIHRYSHRIGSSPASVAPAK